LVEILNFFDTDPGSAIRDNHPGSATLIRIEL
jgi:hypothetical protein